MEESMPNTKLGEMQFQFAEIVWHYAPLPSGELVRICQQELNWKKPPPIQYCGNCAKRDFSRTRMDLFQFS